MYMLRWYSALVHEGDGPNVSPQTPDLRLPTEMVVALLEDSAARSGCDTFGLEMAESWRMSDFGAISLLLTHQRTLRDAITATIRYRHLLNDTVALSLEDDGSLVILREELVGAAAARSRQAIELALGVVFRMFRALLGPQWNPRNVQFTHAAPAELAVHRRVFGPRVVFGGEFNGIVCEAADVDRPNPSADPAMAGHAVQASARGKMRRAEQTNDPPDSGGLLGAFIARGAETRWTHATRGT